MRIYLTGFMGAGKTTVGEALAERLGVPAVDLDREVERAAGRTVAEIFATEGEAAFRELEHDCLRRTLEHPAAVVALGGGTLGSERNRELVQRAGVSVWLRPSFRTLLSRLGREEQRRRPLFRDPEQARALYLERRSTYAAAELRCDITAAETPRQVAARIARQLRGKSCAI